MRTRTIFLWLVFAVVLILLAVYGFSDRNNNGIEGRWYDVDDPATTVDIKKLKNESSSRTYEFVTRENGRFVRREVKIESDSKAASLIDHKDKNGVYGLENLSYSRYSHPLLAVVIGTKPGRACLAIMLTGLIIIAVNTIISFKRKISCR